MPFLQYPTRSLQAPLGTLLVRSRYRQRLRSIAPSLSVSETPRSGLATNSAHALLGRLSDRLGRAGFCEIHARRRVKRIFWVGSLALATLSSISFLLVFDSLKAAAAGCLVGTYVSLVMVALFLRRQTRCTEQETLLRLPILLENLILLLSSGLGLLPALQAVVEGGERRVAPDPVTRYFHLVYDLTSSGIPLSEALEMVAEASTSPVMRHVLLHIDVSASEGGELVGALKSLSDHSHAEWKIGVSERVRRLEALVVFPVFFALLGLILLASAVPLVPVVEFSESLRSNQVKRTVGTQGANFQSEPSAFDLSRRSR